MMDIAKAVLWKWPGKTTSIGETYESIVWNGEDKPTETQVVAAWEEYKVWRDKEAQRKAILKQLADIDARSIRALRESNAERLAELEAQATVLRGELNSLGE